MADADRLRPWRTHCHSRRHTRCWRQGGRGGAVPGGAGVPTFQVDRSNNRIQVFRPDGTYVRELFIAREVRTPTGTAVTMTFSPDRQQRFLHVASGDQRIRILDRQTLQVIGTIGRLGHYAGQCHHITDLAVDSQGNLYASENEGRRVQKFVFKGLSTTSRQ